jgi:hypothetical protein
MQPAGLALARERAGFALKKKKQQNATKDLRVSAAGVTNAQKFPPSAHQMVRQSASADYVPEASG